MRYKMEGDQVELVEDLMEWAEWMETGECRIGKTEIEDVEISTVFLGVDHQFGDGPPLLFETMVFGGPLDQDQWRYSTRAQAVEGHQRAVLLVQASQMLNAGKCQHCGTTDVLIDGLCAHCGARGE